eukprot:TRINITY_DN3852_c0_g1_i7.p1 TRINITY_DN3852_c0_g1~~TRINITY_DN3852_c0_g1_i7.p1  ORF type:complete len:450 (-),score=110.10 TRINITY_DN3852_c0_g1_i7:105-1259(-)
MWSASKIVKGAGRLVRSLNISRAKELCEFSGEIVLQMLGSVRERRKVREEVADNLFTLYGDVLSRGLNARNQLSANAPNSSDSASLSRYFVESAIDQLQSLQEAQAMQQTCGAPGVSTQHSLVTTNMTTGTLGQMRVEGGVVSGVYSGQVGIGECSRAVLTSFSTNLFERPSPTSGFILTSNISAMGFLTVDGGMRISRSAGAESSVSLVFELSMIPQNSTGSFNHTCLHYNLSSASWGSENCATFILAENKEHATVRIECRCAMGNVVAPFAKFTNFESDENNQQTEQSKKSTSQSSSLLGGIASGIAGCCLLAGVFYLRHRKRQRISLGSDTSSESESKVAPSFKKNHRIVNIGVKSNHSQPNVFDEDFDGDLDGALDGAIQ